jgi:PncC family amidohydrolase
MQTLLPLAEKIGAALIARRETVGVAESSTGGLISAALLAVPGASAYFRGGGVIYTQFARAALVAITEDDMKGMQPSTEIYASLLASRAKDLLGATWGLSETGASGPRGNRYGDKAGHSCLAITGPISKAITIETNSGNRIDNMRAFALHGLQLLHDSIGAGR